jgi:hypothetical protein
MFQNLNPIEKNDVINQFHTGIREALTVEHLYQMANYINYWNPDEIIKQSLRILWQQKYEELTNK